jgi:ribose transport system ATP-binding protein
LHQLLSIEHLTKEFPGQTALDDVSIRFDAGQTHALVGQNGSGKSTLIKILAGYHQPTYGTATMYSAQGGELRDDPFTLGDGRAASAAGIRFVHQDLALVDSLSTVENLSLGSGFRTRFGRINWPSETKRAIQDLLVLGFDDFDVTAPVGSLAPSQRTAVALARSLRDWEKGARLLVLDEPTASLPGDDVERLFNAVHRVKERGVAILYVSHHLDEVFEIADIVTVLRDGRVVETLPVHALDHDRLIELMIGHKLDRKRAIASTAESPRVLLSLQGVSGGNVHHVDLRVHAGEVVGVAGISGSGREHLVPLISGEVPTYTGTVRVGDVAVPPYHPRSAIAAGGAFLAADRSSKGVFSAMSVAANTTICNLRTHSRRGRLLHHGEHAETRQWSDRLSVRSTGTSAPIASLSGGNQQKVLFARGLRLQPKVLVLDEPTHGVDVGAKEEIHSIIDEAAATGVAVVVASTDTEELVRLAHRVVVFRQGRIAVELTGNSITDEAITRSQSAAFGGTVQE